MSFIRNAIGDVFGGGDAADAALQASQVQADAQRDALALLQERDQPLLDIREQALPTLSGFYGLGGGDQSQLIQDVQESPFYQFNLDQAQEQFLRNQAATGGLRGGSSIRGVSDITQGTLQDLTNQRLQGLSAFAFPQLSTNQQANLLGQIGGTQAGGILGAEQARQTAFGTGLNTLIQGAQAFI